MLSSARGFRNRLLVELNFFFFFTPLVLFLFGPPLFFFNLSTLDLTIHYRLCRRALWLSECTQWHLRWRKLPPGPIKWPGTNPDHMDSSCLMLLFFKDAATLVVWRFLSSCCQHRFVQSQAVSANRLESGSIQNGNAKSLWWKGSGLAD